MDGACNAVSFLWTNSVKRSPSWQTDVRSASQEILCFLSKPKAHYRFHKTLPLAPILVRWIKSTSSWPFSFRSSLILSSDQCLGLQNGLFHSSFPTNILYELFIFQTSVTLPAHLIPLIIHGEGYKLCSSLFCSFLQPRVRRSKYFPPCLVLKYPASIFFL